MDGPTAAALNNLQERIRADIKVGRLKLPALPHVAGRIRQALAVEEQSAQQIARVVQLDPALSARLLQVANSARYPGTQKVTNVRDAVARLGLETTRNLATALSLHSAFEAKDERAKRYLETVWRESCRVAAIGNVLASVTPPLVPDQALLGGLVHNIGALPLVPYLSEAPALLDDPRTMDLLLGRLQARLGSALLKHWGFDPQLVPIPEQADDWMRESEGKPDYVDVVLVARVHAMFGAKKGNSLVRSLDSMPAFRKFPLSRLGAGASVQLIEEAREEIASMMEILRGPGRR